MPVKIGSGAPTKFKARKREEKLPEGRPCDWCHQPVDRGYIHRDCVVLELAEYFPEIA
jgi:hypothetical protein